jgi:hypothetical protein
MGPNETMGVSHVGTVTGDGRFELRAVGNGRTEFIWDETLTFPRWMGGALGASIARAGHDEDLAPQPAGLETADRIRRPGHENA